MTLSELSYKVRVWVKLGGVFVVVILVIYSGMIFVLSQISGRNNPHQQEAGNLNLAFGKIPKVVIEQSKDVSGLSFILDTIDGDYPPATQSAPVYFVPTRVITLSDRKRADTVAQLFGFDLEIANIRRIDDVWIYYEDRDKYLRLNMSNGHYAFRLKPGQRLQSLVEATPSADLEAVEEDLVNRAKSELSEKSVYSSILAQGTTNAVPVIYDLAQKNFIPAKEGQQPQALRVDFFKKDDVVPYVSAKYYVSQTYVIFAPLDSSAEIVESEYKTFEALTEEGGMYPLISPADAWTQLENGNVSVISLSDSYPKPIKIRDIYIALYDPESYQQYIQPVYVFLGTGNFVGYYPAVKPLHFIDNISVPENSTTSARPEH